ncbi:hypothetical protein GN156_02525 [bacterium LRH843]|nr:hypothetical protein [bacterium LRH843]
MNKLQVETIKEQNDYYVAMLGESVDKNASKAIKAGERMLVDSDGLAFIYILEDQSELYYVYFPKSTWEELKRVYESGKTITLEFHEEMQLELTSIHEELTFLIENIKGNGNYGDEMERAVQEVFGQ